MLAHTSRALQLLFQTVTEVDTLEELARVGTIAVELYEGDDAVLRELMTGRLARLLALARHTGRRITAICELHASDVLLSTDVLTRVLAETGQDPALARYMPHGAIRWRAESDKQGYEDVSPISLLAKAALERYLRAHPRVGDVWMFPQSKHPDRPINETLARVLRMRAEQLAELPHIERGGFHSYRRAYASDRKHLPDVDVARSAGWRDLATMKRSCQQPDPANDAACDRKRARKGLKRTHIGHTPEGKRRAFNGLGS